MLHKLLNLKQNKPVPKRKKATAITNRTDMLRLFTRRCYMAVGQTLEAHRVPFRVKRQIVGRRTISVGVKIGDPTAVAPAQSPRVLKALSHGSGLVGVVPVEVGPVLFYQFPYPQRVNGIELWEPVEKVPDPTDPFFVGVSYDNQPVRFNLSDAPHAMVVGTTGAGKTELLNTILYSLCLGWDPAQLGLVVVDPKGEFEPFDGVRQLKYPIARTTDHIRAVINGFTQEYEQRRASQQFNHNQHWLLVLDEADKSVVLGDKDNEVLVRTVARDGRAYNMHLIVSTHKPVAHAIGETIEYLDNQFLGRVTRAVSSGHIEAGLNLHRLGGQGEFLHHVGGEHVRFQGALTPKHLIEKLPRHEKPLKYPVVQPTEVIQHSRQVWRPDAETLATYLYHGSQRITPAMAEELLELSLDQHRFTRQFVSEIEGYYKGLLDD